MKHRVVWLALGLLMLSDASAQACTNWASSRYEVPAELLQAIAQVESSTNPRAFNRNVDGTHDIGLMQINSRWLRTLHQHGLTENDLWDPCVNTLVAAWILSENFRLWGPTYRALGAYHSPSPARQIWYARRVLGVTLKAHPEPGSRLTTKFCKDLSNECRERPVPVAKFR
jgi:soluble lytic murein transglycosylase-like protein